MSTRSLLLVQQDNDYKISFLDHYDGFVYFTSGITLYGKGYKYYSILKNKLSILENYRPLFDIDVSTTEDAIKLNAKLPYTFYTKVINTVDYIYVADLDNNLFEIYINGNIENYGRFHNLCDKILLYKCCINTLPEKDDFISTIKCLMTEYNNGNHVIQIAENRILSISKFLNN